MAHRQRIPRTTTRQQPRSLRGFILLVVIVVISGGLLWSQGELVNPLPNITMLLGGTSDEPGFMAVSAAPESADSTTVQTSVTTAETQTESAAVAETTTTTAATVTDGMTMETFIAELTAAGVDVDAVSTTMSAEGRSLENLLTVVNSGRVTVADLALRLNGETPVSAEPPTGEGGESDSISWEALGSVAYNLWFMLAATLVVIVLTRPVNWLVNRIKHSQPAAKPA